MGTDCEGCGAVNLGGLSSRGFTLIELLIVMLIVSLLATIAQDLRNLGASPSGPSTAMGPSTMGVLTS
ncbi:MAG: prepilin-type N-terminal cleavage/methylation domain-containing protein [Gemmatimonadetes bacterium]|nr:prepilin-type N-terminal cleavage/methylation domain-containing protein [Gemmatimonadota bacterium]